MTLIFIQKHNVPFKRSYQNFRAIALILHNNSFDDVICKPSIDVFSLLSCKAAWRIYPKTVTGKGTAEAGVPHNAGFASNCHNFC